MLSEVNDLSFNFFHSEDVVRHPVVAKIVIAYEAWETEDQKRRQAIKAEKEKLQREHHE